MIFRLVLRDIPTLLGMITEKGYGIKAVLTYFNLSPTIIAITAITAALALATKAWDAYAGAKEKAAKEKIKEYDEDISKYDEEISSLEKLQEKLVAAKGNKQELAKIQAELNAAVGETKGLLTGETNAWETANKKLKNNIALQKQQRAEAEKGKRQSSKDAFDNNTFETGGWIGFDARAEDMRAMAKTVKSNIDIYNNAGDEFWFGGAKFKKDDYSSAEQWAVSRLGYDANVWNTYWEQQVGYAYDAFSDVIENYEGVGGQDFIRNIISSMTKEGASSEEIRVALNQVKSDKGLQDLVNNYWESLTNPDIDSNEALNKLKEHFETIKKKYPQLATALDSFYNGILAGDPDTSTIDEIVEQTESLKGALTEAATAYDVFKDAQKEFSSDGALSNETIIKILEKFPALEDELYEYIMGLRTGASVMELLKAESDEMAIISEDAFKRMYLSSNGASEKIIKHADSMFDAIGLGYKSELSIAENINSQIIESNGTVCTTFQEQWGNAVKNAGGMLQAFASGFSNLLTGTFFNGEYGIYTDRATGNWYNKSQYDENGDGYTDTVSMTDIWAEKIKEENKGISDEEARKRANNAISSYAAAAKKNNEQIEADKKAFDEKMKELAARGDDSGSDKNEALDNYLKDAENRYKIHQDEAKYIEELQWAKDNLTKSDNERLEIAGKINEAYRDLADNRIKDLEHQNELLLAQGKTEYDLISNYRQMQDVLHAEAERLRGQGYGDNSNEIQDLQNKWLDYDKKILDADLENSKKWIEARKNYGDWRSWGDSEVEAWGRVLKRLREEYPNAVEEIAEVEKEYRDAVLDGISRYYEDQIQQLEKQNEKIKENWELQKSQWESLLTLQQKYFDNANFVEDTKTDIKKELDASMTMYKYLDENARGLLFNEDDYIALSEALDKLNAENESLKDAYKSDIWSATAETIEEVTQQYEHQFELKQKEYEILKSSLDVEKKRTKLNNVLNERNTRMFINGRWQWVANVEDVKNAQEELADAELEAAKILRDKEQTLANQELEAHIARLETQEKFLDKELKEAQDKWDEIQKSLEDPVTDISDILKDVAENGTPQLKSIIDDISVSLNDLNTSLNTAANNKENPPSSGGNSSGAPSSGGYGTTLPSSGYGSTSDGKWVDAYIPGSGNTSVWVDNNGKTQTNVPIGTIITTEDGRNYKVNGGSAGNYSSTEITKAELDKIKNGKVYDSGGVASGKGLLAKAVDDEEIVLPPHLSKLILSPDYSEKFKTLVKGLESFYNFPNINTTTLPALAQRAGSTTYDNRIFIDGIALSPQESEALSSVLSRIIPNH